MQGKTTQTQSQFQFDSYVTTKGKMNMKADDGDFQLRADWELRLILMNRTFNNFISVEEPGTATVQ